MSLCRSQHRYNPDFEHLPEDQSYFNGRHKCAGCAYEAGYEIGLNHQKPVIDFSTIPNSQAGTVRHKSAQIAFEQGYSDGITSSYG